MFYNPLIEWLYDKLGLDDDRKTKLSRWYVLLGLSSFVLIMIATIYYWSWWLFYYNTKLDESMICFVALLSVILFMTIIGLILHDLRSKSYKVQKVRPWLCGDGDWHSFIW